jgi:hypothetical protein
MRLHSQSQTLSGNNLSDESLDRIQKELQELNANLADANDIATLATYKAMPPELDNDSRKALKLLRDKVMERARNRAASYRSAQG